MRRLPVLIAALALVLTGAGALPAYADDPVTPTPTSSPSSHPGDPFDGQSLPPGDVYIITPGSTATSLPSTADPDHVQDQIKKDIAKGKTQTPSTVPSGTASTSPGATPSTSTPTDDLGSPGGDGSTDAQESTSSPMLWWALVAVVLALAIGAVIVLRVRRRRTTDEDPGVR